MTTAARPTWAPATGSASARDKGGSRQVSSKDLPGQLQLKVRQQGQGTRQELAAQDLKADLERRERDAAHIKGCRDERTDSDDEGEDVAAAHRRAPSPVRQRPHLQLVDDATVRLDADEVAPARPKDTPKANAGDTQPSERHRDDDSDNVDDDADDADADADADSSGSGKGARDPNDHSHDDGHSSADDDDDHNDDDDDDQELLRELERIKRERAEAQERAERDQAAEAERKRMEAVAQGNPLLNRATGSAVVKRRWDDDVVFKNCTRSEPSSSQKRFINDPLRSDFHRKFMNKYIQ